MKELIIKVDDPGERAWDGSLKVFETKELVRCKDCISFYKNDNMFNTNAQKGMRCKASSIDPDWFCADGERKEGR